jgi:hypothetical protein
MRLVSNPDKHLPRGPAQDVDAAPLPVCSHDKSLKRCLKAGFALLAAVFSLLTKFLSM